LQAPPPFFFKEIKIDIEKINSLESFLDVLPETKDELFLFRGQREEKDLLPKIARNLNKIDTIRASGAWSRF
jgi:hypothetical protein